MKINAISNTNFKGLYIDRSRENDGNWRMEYYPYSWEAFENKEPYKEYDYFSSNSEIKILAEDLPDNEADFVDNTRNHLGYVWERKDAGNKYKKDILGTQFYYCDLDNNVMRSLITPMKAMNLEDSLRVKDQKLSAFLDRKYEAKYQFENDLANKRDSFSESSDDYYKASRDYEKSVFERKNNKSVNKSKMDYIHAEKMNLARKFVDDTENYIKLINSIENVESKRQQNQKMISELKEARETGNLIDISVRDIEEPDKPLWEALQNIPASMDKLIALPFTILSFKEFINSVTCPKGEKRYIHECMNAMKKIITSKAIR